MLDGNVYGSWSNMLLRCKVFINKCYSVSGIRIRIFLFLSIWIDIGHVNRNYVLLMHVCFTLVPTVNVFMYQGSICRIANVIGVGTTVPVHFFKALLYKVSVPGCRVNNISGRRQYANYKGSHITVDIKHTSLLSLFLY